MSDGALVKGFVHGGEREGADGRLVIETDCLVLDAWWPVAFRVAPDVFGVRADPPPSDTSAVTDVEAELRSRGLVPVGTDPPLLHVITYAEIAWGLVSWTLWAPDAGRADEAMTARAGAGA